MMKYAILLLCLIFMYIYLFIFIIQTKIKIKIVALKEIDLENLSNLIEISSKLVEKRTVIYELAIEFESIKTKLNQANNVDVFTTQLNKTIHEYTLKEINNVLLDGTRSVFLLNIYLTLTITEWRFI
jgi:hypothetical protein